MTDLHSLLHDSVDPGTVPWDGVVARVRQRRRRRRVLGAGAAVALVLVGVLAVPHSDSRPGELLAQPSPSPSPTVASPPAAPGPPLLLTFSLDDRYELRVVDDDLSDGTASVLRVLGDGPVRDVTPPGWDERWQVVDVVYAHDRLWVAAGETCGLSGAGRTYTSDDLGRTWRRADGLPAPGCHAGDGAQLVVDDADRATLDVYSSLVDQDVTYGTGDGGRTWARQATPNGGRVTGEPGAGAPCSRQHEPVAVLHLAPDAPSPRCLGVVPRQRLRVVNDQTTPVTVTFADLPPRTLRPDGSTLYDVPLGDLVRSGAHQVRVTDGYSPEVFLRGTAGDDRAG